jgi:hypothetical protein
VISRRLSSSAASRPFTAKSQASANQQDFGNWPGRLAFRAAESPHEIDNQAYQQNETNSATADNGASKVKPAAAEQNKKDK